MVPGGHGPDPKAGDLGRVVFPVAVALSNPESAPTLPPAKRTLALAKTPGTISTRPEHIGAGTTSAHHCGRTGRIRVH